MHFLFGNRSFRKVKMLFLFSQPFLRRVKMHFLFGNRRSRKVKMHFPFSQPFLRRVKMHFLFGNWHSRKVKMLFPFFATIFTIFTSCLGDVFESFAIHAICFSKQYKRHSETTLISNKNPRDPRDPWRRYLTLRRKVFGNNIEVPPLLQTPPPFGHLP